MDILSFQVHELENVGYTMGNSKPMVVRFTYQTLAAKLAGQIKKKGLILPPEASKEGLIKDD